MHGAELQPGVGTAKVSVKLESTAPPRPPPSRAHACAPALRGKLGQGGVWEGGVGGRTVVMMRRVRTLRSAMGPLFLSMNFTSTNLRGGEDPA